MGLAAVFDGKQSLFPGVKKTMPPEGFWPLSIRIRPGRGFFLKISKKN
jgi:hypothetical protein